MVIDSKFYDLFGIYLYNMQMAKAIHASKYVECSALTNEGIQGVFEEAISAYQGSIDESLLCPLCYKQTSDKTQKTCSIFKNWNNKCFKKSQGLLKANQK